MENSVNNARIRVLKEHIIFVKELEKPDPDDILHSARETCRLGENWDHFGIVVEFSGFVLPSFEARHKVSEEVAKIRTKLTGVAVVTRRNIFLEVACKFIYTFARFPEISIHQTQESAIQHLEQLNIKRQQKKSSPN